jgi:hypothetical protein
LDLPDPVSAEVKALEPRPGGRQRRHLQLTEVIVLQPQVGQPVGRGGGGRGREATPRAVRHLRRNSQSIFIHKNPCMRSIEIETVDIFPVFFKSSLTFHKMLNFFEFFCGFVLCFTWFFTINQECRESVVSVWLFCEAYTLNGEYVLVQPNQR